MCVCSTSPGDTIRLLIDFSNVHRLCGANLTVESKFLPFDTESCYSEDVYQPGPQTMARLLQGLLAAQGVSVPTVPETPTAVLRLAKRKHTQIVVQSSRLQSCFYRAGQGPVLLYLW